MQIFYEFTYDVSGIVLLNTCLCSPCPKAILHVAFSEALKVRKTQHSIFLNIADSYFIILVFVFMNALP